MGKLGTAFTPITNPSGSRLLTLIDEATGLRYKINITDFFELVDAPATFASSLKIDGALGYGNVETATQRRIYGKTAKVASNTVRFSSLISDAFTSNDIIGDIRMVITDASASMKSEIAFYVNVGNSTFKSLNLNDDGSATFLGIIKATPTANVTAGFGLLDIGTSGNNITTGDVARFRNNATTHEGNVLSVIQDNASASSVALRIQQDASVPLALDVIGKVGVSSLAGTGTRNVVVDANGVMSAP